MANSLLRTEAIFYGDVRITVQCLTLLTDLRRADLQKRLAEAVTIGADFLDVYLNVAVLTIEALGLPFDLPVYSADVDIHLAAFEAFLNLPGELQLAWNNGIILAATPPNTNADLHPGVAAKDPKRSKRASSSLIA